MPIATPEVYNEMLDKAKKGGFAFPAINCTSSETINAAFVVLPRQNPTASFNSRPVVLNSAPAFR